MYNLNNIDQCWNGLCASSPLDCSKYVACPSDKILCWNGLV